jgi:hypothetical protein
VVARFAALCTVLSVAALSAAPPVCAQAPAPPAAPDAVLVHIATPNEVDLEVQRDQDWVPICTSPCDRLVRPGDAYRVSSDAVPASNVFAIKPAPRLTLTVDPSTKQSRVGGVVFTVAGAAGFVPGGVVTAGVASFFIFGAILVCPLAYAFGVKNYGGCVVDAAELVTPYYASPYVWVPALVGAGLMVIGVTWLAATSGGHPTTVTTALLPPRPPRLRTAFASWHTLEMPEVALPPPSVLPLLSGTF